jgi:ATP synthase protein I
MNEKVSQIPLEVLGERIRKLKAETAPVPPRGSREPASGLGMAFGVAAHMVSGLGVGAGIGYFLDSWLGTSPWLLVLFFFMGGAAGILNTYRMAMGMDMAAGYRPAPDDQGSERPAADANRQNGSA